jgi:hypothetical protein
MANIFVKISTNTRLGHELQRVADILATAESHLNQVRNVMDNMTDGATFTTIETEFGLPGGLGGPVYEQVVSGSDALSTSSPIQLIINALGGITS